jgi:hypothetical protein
VYDGKVTRKPGAVQRARAAESLRVAGEGGLPLFGRELLNVSESGLGPPGGPGGINRHHPPPENLPAPCQKLAACVLQGAGDNQVGSESCGPSGNRPSSMESDELEGRRDGSVLVGTPSAWPRRDPHFRQKVSPEDTAVPQDWHTGISGSEPPLFWHRAASRNQTTQLGAPAGRAGVLDQPSAIIGYCCQRAI